MSDKIEKTEGVHNYVRDAYSKIAVNEKSSCCGANTSCCGIGNPEKLVAGLGYAEAELASLPDGANMGLSCGNPTAVASLKPGETVLDLGSGGGFDVFIAAEKVGASGKSIGVDMTHEMLMKARNNINQFTNRTGLTNVEFRLGEIEHLPIADNSIDAVISNCVINLSPDKPQVWKEIFRALKPGGRAAVSDLALLKPLPDNVAESVSALVGCVAGAVLISDTEAMIKDAGFTEFKFDKKPGYIEKMTEWNDPLYCAIIELLPKNEKLSDYITSLNISVIKAPEENNDEKMQELIAIGASVTAHCQPCFTYHQNRAKELGISEGKIKNAVAVGESLQRGADSFMSRHVRAALGSSIKSSSCCMAGESEESKKPAAGKINNR
jgi:AhpD family alkylhydroperoxidase